MSQRQPTATVQPVVQRLRIRYGKRDRLRFASHRDFARALERALRRAGVPIAYSAGFTPHPKVSYVGAAPTGAASEAEYAELGLARAVDPTWVRDALTAALPTGLPVLDCVEADAGGLPDRIDASAWKIVLPGVTPRELETALAAFRQRTEVLVERLTKSGKRDVDVRGAVVSASGRAPEDPCDGTCAILTLVVRHTTPAVRPDDVLAALRLVAGLVSPVPARATRLAQGRLDDEGQLADPLAPDRAAAIPGGSPAVGAGQGPAPSIGTTPAG